MSIKWNEVWMRATPGENLEKLCTWKEATHRSLYAATPLLWTPQNGRHICWRRTWGWGEGIREFLLVGFGGGWWQCEVRTTELIPKHDQNAKFYVKGPLSAKLKTTRTVCWDDVATESWLWDVRSLFSGISVAAVFEMIFQTLFFLVISPPTFQFSPLWCPKYRSLSPRQPVGGRGEMPVRPAAPVEIRHVHPPPHPPHPPASTKGHCSVLRTGPFTGHCFV